MSDFSKLDRLLQTFTEEGVPGCAVAVMRDGKLLHESYAGYADPEKKTPVGAHTMFRQASSTKLLTYVIGMMLYEEGKFLFSDPLYKFLPEWKDTKKYICLPNGEHRIVPTEHPITVRDAFIMSCGLPYCMGPLASRSDEPTLNRMSDEMEKLCAGGRVPELREEAKAMSRVPVMFEPGTHWLYGFGSELVGVLVETLTGKSVRQNMKERLIDPLGLQDTATLLTEEEMKKLVRLVRIAPDGSRTIVPEEADDILKIGGVPEYSRANLNASARDLAVFMYMLANGGSYNGVRFLGRKTIDMMRTNQLNEAQLADYYRGNGADLLGYGYGMGVRTLISKAEGASNGSIGSFGWSGGYGTWAEADPEENLSIVYMHNTWGLQNELFHMRVRDVLYAALD